MIGTTLDGKYLIKRQLGAGAMGAVYEAEHTGTGRRVAVKVITNALAQNPDLISRFQREARAAGAIDTKHITQVLDTGIDRETRLPFMVMEFLTGMDVQDLLRKKVGGPISPDLSLRIAAQVCLGLQKAHDGGVVHRDIKPANLFLAHSDGEIIVKVLDFGIAKVHMEQAQETESAGLTRTGSMMGSPLYMSPEQARGSKNIDHRADLWSLGIALYQCLCGRTPNQHVTALGELIIAICSTPPTPVQQYAPWVPPEVAAIVHRCIRQNPDERFQSAKEMLAAIRPLLPYGWGITEDMFVPVDQAARAQRAVMYSVPTAVPYTGTAPGGSASHPGLGSGVAQGGTSHPGAGSNPNIGGSASHPGQGSDIQGMTAHPGYGSNPNASSQGGSTGILVQSQAAAPKHPSSLPLVMGGLFITVVGLGAAGFWVMRNSTPAPAPPPAPTVVAPTVTTVTAAPVPPPAPPVEQDQSNRRVKVAIVPPDTQVEVEGKPVTLKNGMLELEGKLGDVFKVRVKKGGISKEEEVIITKDGPSLPMITPFYTAATVKSSTPALPKGATDKFE
ncbi:serine/threonine-protein kinase [Polyangium sp. 15x6]|uniref:serine/threonine protein kinase n=1 Tax=Polyangium sp. 15x6 TaxID=3042687 RepID=UPI00249C3536|nr:serine/threonine-protein kinase [Polyangium sp. 15x6]MDI3284239.1 serine/threonine-protein kinase [Polyangium sp. 15x6]